MSNCTACGTPARKTVDAIVTRGPGVAVPGKVCGPCAATGVLIVVGDDRAIEEPQPTPIAPQKPTGLPKLKKEGFGLRELAGTPNPTTPSPKGLSKREAEVLGAVVHLRGLTRRQITTLTGAKRRSRDNLISVLNVLQYVTTGDRIEPTETAIALKDSLPKPLTGRKYVERLLRELPGREADLLRVLTEGGTRVIVSREELTRRTGMLRRNRDNIISKVRGRGLVDAEQGGISAMPELFDGWSSP